MTAQISRRTQEERRAASRAALVHHAMLVFAERGYARTTVADIVAGTGYSAGAFYHHFANKAECLWAVVDYRREVRHSWADLAEELDPQGSSLAELIAEAFRRLTTSLEGRHAWTMVMVEFYRAHRDEPEMTLRLAQLYQRWIAEVADFVRFLQDHHLGAADRDPVTVAGQVVAFAEGLATHAQVHSLPAQAVAVALQDGVLRLLRD